RTTTRCRRASTGFSACQHPAALFENLRRTRVELSGGLLHRQLTVDGALGYQAHLRGDTLPFGHLGRRLHSFELLTEGSRMDVRGQLRVRPRGASWWQIAGQRVKATLHGGLRQELDETPRGILMARRPKHYETRAAGDRRAGTVGPGQRRRHPRVLLAGR